MLDPSEDDEEDGATSDQDGGTRLGVPGYRAIKPCSIGLTFAADAEATVVVSLSTTARYIAVETDPAERMVRRNVDGRGCRSGYL